MPKRTDIKSILILGAGPIVIGQACEFDYSGVQACKALKEDNYRVILINSNPATIMTDPMLADATYIEPIRWETVAKIIETEKPDALLPTMGGQTALNCALDLDRHGILEKYNVITIGANKEAINKAEDRELFNKAMKKIGLNTPKSGIARTLNEAFAIQKKIGFPCIIRPSFTMGGAGGGIAYNNVDFETICKRGLALSPTNELLIDESLIGWKEFEMEVVRDKNDNCIIVCSIENIDPMGVHTGDSITVAPAMTLTDKEFQIMRDASIAVLREIGVETGGSNVQFGICPKTGRMVVIEMNPRVSRSSALASKATGFPIAKVAAKLAVGYTLDELRNEITGDLIPASFEPTIDYVVTKIPRFAFEKFPQASDRLTTQMKSVGEVMAIGRTFQESIQKALRSLETGATGFNSLIDQSSEDAKQQIIYQLEIPGPDRIFYLADAFRIGMNIEQVFNHSKIDPWFLYQIVDIVHQENNLKELSITNLTKDYLFRLKQQGFGDTRIAQLLNVKEQQIKNLRHEMNIKPVYKQIDTCAGEFEVSCFYMYSTYDQECEARVTNKNKIMVIGAGPNRIGQGIEFDYCCVHAILAAKDSGYETIMINCNPETVSTDYDISDRLYFEPITLENVVSIIEIENPTGIIVQYGGQTPLKLATLLTDLGFPLIGTSADNIDKAENRERFQSVIKKLDLLQPHNTTASSIEEAVIKASNMQYPLIVRPSYVLGGRAMETVYNEEELRNYINRAIEVSNDSPVLLDSFLNRAIELDVDAISDGETVVIGAIMQHIEQAGVHSGDSSCSLPAYSVDKFMQDKIREQVKKLALKLNVIGLMNVQFAIQDNKIYIIEVNPRASRTVPFVSKCIGHSLAKIAAKVMFGQSLTKQNFTKEIKVPFFAVKGAVFPFNKFPQVDPILGPEMKSTGEVMGIGKTFAEAFSKALLANNKELPTSGNVILSVRDQDKTYLLPLANQLISIGFKLLATKGTAEILMSENISVVIIKKVKEGKPNIVDTIVNNDACFIINTTEGKQAINDSYDIRRQALINKILYTTTLSAAFAFTDAIAFGKEKNVRKLQTFHNKSDCTTYIK